MQPRCLLQAGFRASVRLGVSFFYAILCDVSLTMLKEETDVIMLHRSTVC